MRRRSATPRFAARRQVGRRPSLGGTERQKHTGEHGDEAEEADDQQVGDDPDDHDDEADDGEEDAEHEGAVVQLAPARH